MRTTLLIMAAGIGSRFGGGIKQLEPVGLQDEIIMDYSIHDAIEAGFDKIIFVIRKDIEAEFKARIGDRIEKLCRKKRIEVCYAFQNLMDIPGEFPEGRTKPWGTGQAVLAARQYIDTPFLVINADDYYGKSAFRKMHDWLVKEHGYREYAMAGFILKNTLSDNGGVTRGICKLRADGSYLEDIVETSNIVKTQYGPAVGGISIDPDSYVSMNMWALPAEFVDVLEKGFAEFFRREVPENPMKAEYLLPIIIGDLLRRRKCTVEVLETRDNWFGVTYKEDKDYVVSSFRRLILDGVYSTVLYGDVS